MSQEDSSNIRAVRGFLKAQYDNDFDTAFAKFATSDFQWVVASRNNPELSAAVPWAGRDLHGKEGYLELTSTLFGEYEPLEFAPGAFYDASSVVFVVGHFRFRHRHTGKLADSDWVARFDMRDALIAGGQFYENTFGVAAARR